MKPLNRLFTSLLRSAGKTYDVPDEIPSKLVAAELWRRSVYLSRGLIRTRRAAFVGANVRLRNHGGIRLGRLTTIDEACVIDGYATSGVLIGDRTKIGAHTIISCTSHMSKMGVGIRIGRDCGISEFSYFGASGGIEIGDDVIMGQFVSFHSENHVFSADDVPIRKQGVTSRGIVVGNDVWIGARVTVLDGSRIGDHSVIAAGAVVSGAFPPGSVIGGVPARVLKSRMRESSG